ncbi:MAG TPA: potassium channel family protein [Solirubrobacteraceae bacterium]|nr:potassium channel family protein [Solirubrobacteraceae bacterium]
MSGESGDDERDESDATREQRRVRFGVLLGAVFAAFLISGIAEPGEAGQVSRLLLNGLTLVLALIAAEAPMRRVRRVAGAVVVLAVVGVLASIIGHPDSTTGRGLDAVLLGCSIPVVIIGTIRNLNRSGTVTLEAVFGVLSVYVLFGMFFAALFGFIAEIEGASVFGPNAASTVAHCIYYSFTTLTTIGYGDLTTKTNFTHTLSVSEALLGQIYLVTVVSLIVSNLGQSHSLRRGGKEPAA